MDLYYEKCFTSNMEWTKENLERLYFDKLGVTLDAVELDMLWDERKKHTVTPPADNMNVALSPLLIETLISREFDLRGLTIDDPRFKKFREEIQPSITYVLFLKKIGLGEHLICSSDNPDIKLIPKRDGAAPGFAYRRRAIPLEVTFIKDHMLANTFGADDAEKIANIIEANKLQKCYSEHTTLLVVLDAITTMLNLEKIALLLKDKGKNFNSIELMITDNDDKVLIACVYPNLATHDFDSKADSISLMY